MAYNDQTSYAMAFANDLVPDDYKEKQNNILNNLSSISIID